MLDIASHFIFIFSTIAEIGVIYALCRRSLSREWKSLVIYEALQIAIDSVLKTLSLLNYSRTVGILYWTTIHIFSIVQFWILLQIVFSLFCWVRSRRLLVLIVFSCFSTTIVLGSIMAFIAPNIYRHKIGNLLLTADRACMFAWCISLVLVILGSHLTGVQWSPIETSIVIAFGVMSLSELLSAEVVSRYGLKVWSYTWTCNSAIYMCCTFFLVFAMFRSPLQIGNISTADLNRALQHQQDRMQSHRERVECI